MPNQGGTQGQPGRQGQPDQRRDGKQEEVRQAGGKDQEHRGGKGNFAEDRERASEAGRKGGQR